jgi:hypothetical protein
LKWFNLFDAGLAGSMFLCFFVYLFLCLSVLLFLFLGLSVFYFSASQLLCCVFFIVFFSRFYALCILESPCAQELSPLTTEKPRRETMCNVKQLEPEQPQEQTTPEQPKNNTQKTNAKTRET